jgi:hypothetical protein
MRLDFITEIVIYGPQRLMFFLITAGAGIKAGE